MKWIHFLLAFYLMAVSFYPCTDSDIAVKSTHALEIAHNHDNHSHDEEHHMCPPFCACNCCGVQMLNYFSVISYEFSIPFQTIRLKESFYFSNLNHSYLGSVWQPPQLV